MENTSPHLEQSSLIRIYVTQGPDQGKEAEFRDGTLLIGRGPRAEFRLTDSAISSEAISLDCRNQICQVRNISGIHLYLDEQVLPSGQQRVWYDDTDLQLTAETCLRLTRASRSAPRRDVKRLNPTMLLAGVLLLIALGILMFGSDVASVDPPGDQEINEVVRELSKLAPQNASVQLLVELFHDARRYELAGQLRNAQEKYRELRHRIGRLTESAPENMTSKDVGDLEKLSDYAAFAAQRRQ